MKTDTSTRLRQIMSTRNLKQVDILNLSLPYQNKFSIKLSKSTLSQYVNGIQSPDQNRIYLLAQTLGVSEAWLMGFDVPMVESKTNSENSPLIEETLNTMKKLERSRQKVVFDTANSQLKEQELEKESASNIITLKNRASELTDEEFEKALDEAVKQTVAFDGKPLDEREQAIAKQMLRDAWEEDNGKR